MSRQLGLWWITIFNSTAKFKTFIWHSLLEETLPISTIGVSKLFWENYQRYFTVSLLITGVSSGTRVFIDWTLIEFCWMFISKHCFKRKTKTSHFENNLNSFQFLVTPFPEAKSFSQAHWQLWLPEKLLFPSAIYCAFLSHFGVQTVLLSVAGTAKHVYTILQVWSLCRNTASINSMTSIYLEVGIFSNQCSTNQATPFRFQEQSSYWCASNLHWYVCKRVNHLITIENFYTCK